MKNKIKEVILRQISLIKPTEEEYKKIEEETEKIIKELEDKLKQKKIKADVFIGGSLAKNTLIKKQKYDIDIFVRFDRKYEDEKLSNLLEKVLKNANKIHGSRDYFQFRKGKIIFEIIPTFKIAKPEQAKNVTDLSYFHVNYIKDKIKKNRRLADEIRLAKSFCFSQGCYGAESFISGFSGYALELLICHYGSFLNFIKAVKEKEKIVLDPRKFYKNKKEIMLELNEAKLQSPIVFVDPTFKERNALAALSSETFKKFKETCKNFLIKPGEKFFEKKDLEKELKKKHKDIKLIEVKTNRQKGDIAGSKLKKFYEFFIKRAEKHFKIKVKEFLYDEERNVGKIYLVLKEKKKIIIAGPSVTLVEHLINFKKKHKNCFIKNRKAYAFEKPISFSKFLENLKKEKAVKEMGITKVGLVR